VNRGETEGRSSSNRHVAGRCDAILRQEQRDVGPVRLPESRAEDFVADFNRIYRGIGFVLDVVEPTERATKKIPGNSRIAGDSILDD